MAIKVDVMRTNKFMKNKLKQMVKTASLSVALLGFSALTWAGAAEDLQEKLAKVDSLKAKFSQTIMDDFGRVIDESSGQFELQRPKQFRWTVEFPYEQEIVADGESLWQFDRDIEQINVSTLNDTLGDTPAALLSNAQLNVAEQYNVNSVQGEGEGVVMYHLSPKDETALFEVMIMEFVVDELKALKIKDNLGQTTLVELSATKINVEFADDYFNFSVPEGVDVIDNREAEVENVENAGAEETETPKMDTEALMN